MRHSYNANMKKHKERQLDVKITDMEKVNFIDS
jgi:hypothetical protein